MEREEYVRRVLEAYRSTPGTAGVVRRADRELALRLHGRGVPLRAVENAMVLAAARRVGRPLGVIRSLAYFEPVIEEVLESAAGEQYFEYLRRRLPVYLARESK